jgi:hypothetical protein
MGYHEVLVHAAGHSEAGLLEQALPGVPPDFDSSFTLYNQEGPIMPTSSILAPTLNF